MTKKKDQWDSINYPELTEQENELIRKARRKGYAEFYPCFPDAEAQSQNTLKGAKDFLNKM